jgi:hypothetical protein
MGGWQAVRLAGPVATALGAAVVPRVSKATLKRLESIENRRGANRPYAVFPPMLSLSEWEAVAMAAQAKLIEECQADAQR